MNIDALQSIVIPAEKTVINSGGETDENSRQLEYQIIEEERKKSTSPGNAAAAK